MCAHVEVNLEKIKYFYWLFVYFIQVYNVFWTYALTDLSLTLLRCTATVSLLLNFIAFFPITQVLLPRYSRAYSIHWSIATSSEATPLKKTDSLSWHKTIVQSSSASSKDSWNSLQFISKFWLPWLVQTTTPVRLRTSRRHSCTLIPQFLFLFLFLFWNGPWTIGTEV